MLDSPRGRRPAGITGLSLFFLAGCLISFTACLVLLFPGGILEPLWRVNPRAHEAFQRMGPWAPALLLSVSLACGVAGLGLWRRRRWGYVVAVGLLIVNLAGDAANVVIGAGPRAAVGLPIVLGLLAYLATRSVRGHFFDVRRP